MVSHFWSPSSRRHDSHGEQTDRPLSTSALRGEPAFLGSPELCSLAQSLPSHFGITPTPLSITIPCLMIAATDSLKSEGPCSLDTLLRPPPYL